MALLKRESYHQVKGPEVTTRIAAHSFSIPTQKFIRMKDGLPVVKRAVAAVSSIGGTPAIRSANGGLDANWMVRHGVPTVTFGAG
jgi:acetylornithine deacetylase/succinyl-diaminopimelate desuccinylase-like protein